MPTRGGLQMPTRVMSVCLRKGGGVLSLSKKDPWVAVNTEYALQTGLKVIDQQEAEELPGGKAMKENWGGRGDKADSNLGPGRWLREEAHLLCRH